MTVFFMWCNMCKYCKSWQVKSTAYCQNSSDLNGIVAILNCIDCELENSPHPIILGRYFVFSSLDCSNFQTQAWSWSMLCRIPEALLRRGHRLIDDQVTWRIRKSEIPIEVYKAMKRMCFLPQQSSVSFRELKIQIAVYKCVYVKDS